MPLRPLGNPPALECSGKGGGGGYKRAWRRTADASGVLDAVRREKGRMGIIAIGREIRYPSGMEQNNPLSLASQESPVAPAGARVQPIRKFSTASAAEKTAVLVKWLEENKARDVTALNVADKSPCMDVIIVVTASSLRHGKSLADGLMEECTRRNYEFLRMEGYQTGQWILADLNDIVVHIFQQEMRGLFRIESLWKQSHVLHGEVPAPAHDAENAFGNED